MTAAIRKTPTATNGGSDNGTTYAANVDTEVEALWQVAHTWLTSVAGTNTITASSDATLVAAIAAYARPMAFWLVPAATNTGPVTIAIDGVTAVAILDKDGLALTAGALVAGRTHEILFDGASFRLQGGGASSSGSQDNAVNGGRLTITTGVPALAGGTSSTTAFWTPDRSNLIALYNGSSAWNIIPSVEQSIKFTDTQNGTLVSGTKVVSGLTDTSKLMVGMKVSGANIGAGSTIASIDSSTQITGTINSTATGTQAVTFKVPADTAVDIFGKNVSSALALRGVLRASFLVANTIAKQDGIDVLSADHTLRWLGVIATGATDGQIDWALTGIRRARVWNRDNKRSMVNVEPFNASGTWTITFGTAALVSEIWGGGGTGGGVSSGLTATAQAGAPGGYSMKRFLGLNLLTVNQTVTIGATSSFGANHSATSGNNGSGWDGVTLTNGAAPGSGSSGDINITGGGGAGGSPAMNTNGTLTATTGAAGAAPRILVTELLEY